MRDHSFLRIQPEEVGSRDNEVPNLEYDKPAGKRKASGKICIPGKKAKISGFEVAKATTLRSNPRLYSSRPRNG